MRARRGLTRKGVEKLSERERTVGIDPDDAAGRWLEEHEPAAEPEPSKARFKSKTLHRWRRREARPGAGGN
jgi:hypothetical protein